MPDRERKRVPDDRSDVLPGPPAASRNTEYPRLSDETSRRVEMKQL